ncbi:MAG: SIS domain-containing protein [Bacillota bacterium]
MLALKELIRNELFENAEVHRLLAEKQVEVILEIARVLIQSVKCRGKILFCGNGGSAADAQHLATELVGRYRRERKALPALALTANTSLLTAISNDYGFEEVFLRQIGALLDKNDVLIALSTSGNSPNVVAAVEAANAKGAVTIGFTGKDGGLVKRVARYSLLVPTTQTARIQEAHLTVGHILCGLIEAAFC